jgi:heme exporter protein A
MSCEYAQLADTMNTSGTESFKLSLAGLGHRFGRQKLFSDLNLEVESPVSLCVAGRNGSGKSTLLRILAGMMEPTRGKVTWSRGNTVLDRAGLRNHLGFISPDVRLYGELTLMENLQFFARLRHVSHARSDLDSCLDEYGLAGHGHKLLATLSSGQKQRAKYIASTIHRPAILMLDEPTSNLDRSGREAVASVVQAQRERGILVVATNEEEEYEFGDHIVQLVD